MIDEAKPKRHVVITLVRFCLHTALIGIAILATLILVQAFASRRMPDLEAWHHKAPESEFVAADLTPSFTLEEYLQLEERVFDELPSYMLDPDNLQGHSPLSRFVRGGPQDPAGQSSNWNRTVELTPDMPKGGVLLLHGLSDSPYSMRSLAEFFFAHGYFVLVMRMPGHGTVPAGLLDATWKDWAAAVKVGARHVQGQIDPSMPFYIVGYSNGGALAIHYCLDALDNADRVPDQLFLLSPAIGITPFARVARWDALYSFIPYFEKSKWLVIELEYDPYKYSSFPKNGGTQSWQLARVIQSQLSTLGSRGRLNEIPPILTFQSIVDDTVRADALVTRLYERLESNGSEVVFFDVNRSSLMDGFVSLDFSQRLDRLIQRADLKYTVTRLTNRDPQSLAIHAQSRKAGAQELVNELLDLEWPKGVFSLAHVAVPFPADDPLYGANRDAPGAFRLHIGTLAPRGERRVLRIPASQLIRLRHNPFHDYMTRRITMAISSGPINSADSQND